MLNPLQYQSYILDLNICQSMLDAMVQLLTGSNDGFNETYFEELVQCMDDYDLNLYTSQVRK